MADITDAFIAAFPDGYPVAKPEARAIGPTLEAAIGLLATAIAGGATAVFETKAELQASGSSANAAYVYNDPTSVPSRPVQGNNGLWVKDGIWTYVTTFVLPATVLAELLDQQDLIAAEVAARIAAVAETNGRVDMLDTGLTAATSAIGGLTTGLGETNGRVDMLDTGLTAATSAIGGLTTGLGETNGRVDILDTGLTAATSAIGGLTTGLGETNGRVDILDTGLTAATAAIGDLTTDLGETNGRVDMLDAAVATEAVRASSAEAAISARLHPGDVPTAFGTALTGAVTASPAYTADSVAIDSMLGPALLLTDERSVAPRAPIPIEPGRVYLIRWAARRKTAPADPLSDAVVYGVQWLTGSLTSAGSTIRETLSLPVADGAVRRTMTASLDVSGVDGVIPSGTRYCRPWIHAYGVTHETYVGIVDLIDITEAWAADRDAAAAMAAEAAARAAGDAMLAVALTEEATLRRIADAHVKGIESAGTGGVSVSQSRHAWLNAMGELAGAFCDAAGNLGIGITTLGGLLLASGAILEAGEYDWDFAIVDRDGNIGLGIRDGSFQSAELSFLSASLAAEVARATSADASINAALESEFSSRNAIDIRTEGIDNTSYPSAPTLHAYKYSWLGDVGGIVHALLDSSGNVGLALTRLGDLLLSSGAMLPSGEYDWDFAVIDVDGNVGFGIRDGAFYSATVETKSFDLLRLDARNKAFSASLNDGVFDTVQLPTAKYNTIVNYGQSLAEGYETWPSLSKTPVTGALMIGDNVDNISSSDNYQVIGTLQFNPLVAYTRSGSVNLTGAEEAALTAGSTAVGEPPVIGLANSVKHALNRRGLSEDDGRNIVAISPAIAGKTIEHLSKGSANTVDAVDRYSILTDGVSKVNTLAGSYTHVVPVVNWMQGEYNYDGTYGGVWTRAEYAAAMNALFDDIAADTMAITGQALPPLFLTYQTGASYTRDVDSLGAPGLHVGMAQLDVALARDDTVMVGPVYPYTDKGGHLDSNGSRWYGHQAAKVARRVLFDEKIWQPLRPLEISADGSYVYIHFHVPVPPIEFASPYVVLSATAYGDKGFKVTSSDGSTSYAISSVDIVADTIIRLTLASAPSSGALVWYADKTSHNGNGNVRDSDKTLAIDKYEYVPDRGMYSLANISALAGKRYPLHNWCIAFCLPIGYTEL